VRPVGAPSAGHQPQSVGRGVIVVTVASGLFVISGYVVNVWMGRLLGPVDYGRFGVVIGLLTVLNVIQNAAIPQAVARAAAQFPELAEGTLRRGAELQLGLAFAMAAVVVVASSALALGFGDPQLAGLFVIAAVILPPYGLFTLLMAFHSGRRAFNRQALTLAAYAAAKAVAVIGLAYLFRLAGAIAGYLIAAAVGAITGWHRVWAPRSLVSYRRMIGFAGPLSLYAIAAIGQMSVDIFFVKAITPSPESAGYYAASQNVARIPYYLMTGLAAIILPAVAAAQQRGSVSASRTAGQALRWALIIVVPVVAVMLVTREPLVELLYSSRYAPSSETLLLLSPAMGGLAVSSIAAGILSGLGRPVVPAGLALIGLVVTIVACVLLVPSQGSAGAALATGVGSVVTLVGMIAVLSRVVPGSIPIVSAARVGAIAALAALLAWIVAADGLALLAAYVGVGAVVAGLLVVSRELTVEELRRLVAGTHKPPAAG
jgi:O-antigen/teichoic acid export membrane protein